MAAAQNLELTLDMVVKNQGAIAELLRDVGKLQKQVKALENATGGAQAAVRKMGQTVRGNTNPIDALSKSARRNRQAMQMAGLQIGDFATQLSTGSNPVQAFNQQLGQLGYALSVSAIGPVAALGRLLAGPFSIAILAATVSLGAMQKDTDKTGDAMGRFGDYALATFQAIGSSISSQVLPMFQAMGIEAQDVTNIAKAIGKSIIDIVNGIALFINLTIRMLIESVRQIYKIIVELAKATASIIARSLNFVFDKLEGMVNSVVPLINKGLGLLGFEARLTELSFGRLTVASSNLLDTIKAAPAAIQAAGQASQGWLLIDLERIQVLAEQNRLRRIAAQDEKDGSGKTKKENSALEKFLSLVSSIANQALPQWKKQLQELNTAFTALSLDEKAQNLKEYAESAKTILSGPLENLISKYEKMNSTISEFEQDRSGAKVLFDSLKEAAAGNAEVVAILNQQYAILLDQIRMAEQSEFAKKQEEEAEALREKWESIGLAIADAFKGMITGAQSWRDALKGIIQSVIDKLFELYVVQQIVGFVTSALGGIFGGGTPTNLLEGTPYNGMATGGYPQMNKPVLVGERGPELFVPTSSGKIIPNHQMGGGGGMVINVDARGSNDPEAVRQQVQQGILEAAPSIVAAAQNRTMNTLRRPRLAGAL